MHPAHKRRLEKKRNREPEARGPMGALRPNVSLSRDPLRREALPPEATELDYTPDFEDHGARPRWFASAACLFLVVFVLRASSFFGAWASSPLVFGSIVLTGILAGAFYFRAGNRDQALVSLLIAVLIAGALATDNPLIPFAALVLALLRVAALAGTGQRHFGAWLAGYMFAPNAFRDVWRALWRRRSLADHLLIGYRSLGRSHVSTHTSGDPKERLAAAREAPEVVLHSQAIMVLVGALLLGFLVLVLTPIPVFAGMFALCVVLLILGGYAVLSLRGYQLAHDMSWAEVQAALRHARAAWFSYPGRRAPGVFQSPAGRVKHRQARTTWTYSGLAAATLLLASYFPVGPVVFGPDPWRAQNARVVEFRMGEDYPTLGKVRASTPGTTATFLAHLDEQTRADYLAASEALRLGEDIQRARGRYGVDIARDAEAWPVLSLLGLVDRPVLHAVALVLALALCFTVPYALFWTAILAVAGRAMVHHYRAYDSPESTYVEPRSLWAAAVERLQGSSNHLERRHLWMGLSREDDYPVLLDRDLLQQHMHILGGTGSGKTSRGITPLLEQVVGADCSAVIIDLKGDMALFESARASANRAGLPFKWFTSQSHRATFAFNPFLQKHMQRQTDLEQAEVYAKAFGLEYGPGYGKSHFSRENRDLLLRCLERFDDVSSFTWLDYEIESAPKSGKDSLFADDKQRQDAGDLIAIIRALARIDALNVSLKGLPPRKDREGRTILDPLDDARREALSKHAIDMGDVLREPSVVYFHLPASIQSASNREIGKFALHALLTAAAEDEEHPQVYVFIDEFQEIASDDLDIFFAQARSKGISLILANQSPSQLSRIGAHMLSSIQDNTFTQQVFAVNDPAQRRVLIELSGEAMYELYSSSERLGSGASPSITQGTAEHIGPRFRPNDIIEMSARDEECLVTFKANKGYTQFDGYPFRMFSDYHIPEEEYRARLEAPWPDDAIHHGVFTPPLVRTVEEQPAPTKGAGRKPAKQTEIGDILDSMEP